MQDLANGDRLALPPNVRILFEVLDLQHASVLLSRCGMVWFSDDLLSITLKDYLSSLRHVPLEEGEEGASAPRSKAVQKSKKMFYIR